MSRYFTEEHEWVEVEGKIATVGITEYAQQQLGDVVFVDVPAEGKQFDKGDEAAVVESVKAASDVYSPISGTIVEGNEVLADEPENAGPLNSHLLVLRALRQMHQTSPAYLKRFMDYADTLLWLEQADGGAKPAPRNVVLGERDKKRKPTRGKTDA